MTRYHLTLKSGNRKTGPIAVSTTSADSCPISCPLKSAGCYADTGPLALHWRKVGGERGVNLKSFTASLESLPSKAPFRHNQAGDLPQIDGALDGLACSQIGWAASHLRGFTYTHHVPTAHNLPILQALNSNLAVNLSADNLTEADELAGLGLPVVSVVPRDTPKRFVTPAGRRGIVCPAQEKGTNTTCATCMVCEKRDRNYIVGFRAHGAQAKQAERVAQAT